MGWYCSYLLTMQANGTFHNVIFQTLRQSGINALYRGRRTNSTYSETNGSLTDILWSVVRWENLRGKSSEFKNFTHRCRNPSEDQTSRCATPAPAAGDGDSQSWFSSTAASNFEPRMFPLTDEEYSQMVEEFMQQTSGRQQQQQVRNDSRWVDAQ